VWASQKEKAVMACLYWMRPLVGAALPLGTLKPLAVKAQDTQQTEGSHKSVAAKVNYQSASVPTGLYAEYKYPPKVGVKRDRLGNDVKIFGVNVQEVVVNLTDARDKNLCLDEHGVELVPFQATPANFYDIDQVISQYYSECCDLVKAATGARMVIAFDHNIRSVSKKGDSMGGGFAVQPPLELVHADYTEASAIRRVRDMTKPPGKNDTLRKILNDQPPIKGDPDEIVGRRFMIVNVWKSIHEAPVQRKPLGILSPESIPEEDIVIHEIHYDDRIGENYNARHGEGHCWWHFPGMTRNEALLIKTWDNAGKFAQCAPPGQRASATFAFHSAVDVQVPPDAPDRESIEVRTIVLF